MNVVHADSTSSATNTEQSQTQNNDPQNVSISGQEFLDNLKQSNPEAYSKLSQEDISSIASQGNVLSVNTDTDKTYGNIFAGGTYVKNHKKSLTIFINSALVKVAKLVGATAIAGTVASIVASYGLSAGPATAITTAIGGTIALLPTNKGAWFKISKNTWGLISYGTQK
ncbi:hypothetical protein GSH19_04970 [Lactobacillus sp. S2-2]|uniref:hypothetical protein n=1 Tax=Lactobacillus sp. S2-2 TaxID=2692917 RepID=UPI001F269A0C|nr:hypothetical protein [Lactobacillus sp. S2-2]MCF6515503.1 hypothetical protein [Lactobacillus sp. S2-2]